jgi:hypothetical protein
MDGDHTSKNLDAGANSATNTQDLTEGIHEDSAQGARTALPVISLI